MLIDWPTTVAQIINFLILLFLLRRFLYRPLIDTMAARREEIAQEFMEAQRQTDEAQRVQRVYGDKLAEWETHRQALLEEAHRDADHAREHMLEQARREVAAEKAAWLEDLSHERAVFLEKVRRLSRQQVLAISRQVLRDLADADIESGVAAAFVARLRNLDSATRLSLRKSMNQVGQEIAVGSAFSLSDRSRQAVEEALKQELDLETLKVSYRQMPELIAGLEVRIGGHKLSWSVDDYLHTLQDSLADVLSEVAEPSGASSHAAD
ncbi:MAG: hypothetical protein GXX93_12765 [Anaerolineae bacterium]|nr:hypothetical protein [Anaerolineae bacterium]